MLVQEVNSRAMLGEYCVYGAGRVFWMVRDGTLFLKTAPATLRPFEDRDPRAYPGSKNTCQDNAAWLEDREKLAEAVACTLARLPEKKARKK